ncbi:MAG: DNA methyltransferase [Gammaproteobacteria bacterium]|nr:DNA methyltransferase [Gammaproteobacteria bacterium]
MNNLTGSEWLKKSFSIWSNIKKDTLEKKLNHPALFPSMLADELIKIYTKSRSEKVLDPFMGAGSTIIGAMKNNIQGIGIDLNEEYCDKAKRRVEDYQQDIFFDKKKFKEPKIINDDSKNILDHVKNNSIDLVITSPPYWDILNRKRTADQKEIRKYSDSKKDLGNIEIYEEFLEELKIIFSDVYKVLKMNKRCISIVMDIRKKDKFYPFHEDQSRIMREIGFELEEYVIWDRQSEYNNCRPLGYPYVYRFNKVHEYVCIYWKR